MDARPNSSHIDALLAALREHLAKADEHERARHAEHLLAKKVAEDLVAEGMGVRAIGRELGVDHSKISRLIHWSGADGTSPFSGPRDPMQGLRRGLDALSDEEITEELLSRRPAIAERILERSALVADEIDHDDGDVAPPINRKAVPKPVLRTFDIVKMGEHLLVVGDATNPLTKERLLKEAGWPYRREFYHPDADDEDGTGDGKMDVVVITDPPYGQGKRSIANDRRANWAAVYQLFAPRGGFAFCAFTPPYFRRAEDGIVFGGGDPKEYLAYVKKHAQWWRDENNIPRVRNTIEAIIYFEREGQVPWIRGRRAIASLTTEMAEEARQMSGGHSTPKPTDVLSTLIKMVSRKGDVVFDPFTGSGSTLRAAHRLGRRFFGVELKPKWAERAVRNWMEETGQDATVRRLNVPWPISMKELIELPEPRAAELAHQRARLTG